MSVARLRSLDDEALGAAIRATGDDLAWPSTPDVERAAREAASSARPRSSLISTWPARPVWPAMPRRTRLVVLFVAALLLLGGAALAAKLVIDLGAVTVITLPGRPTALPTHATTGDHSGTPVSLRQAERLTGITPGYPAALGRPDEVWTEQGQVGFDPLDTAPWIAMTWDAASDLRAIADTERGALLIQFHGDAQVAVKALYEEDDVLRPVRLGDLDAYWITGPHEFRLPVDGGLRSFRVDGSVLLWQDGSDTFRLETALPLAGAKALASSIPL